VAELDGRRVFVTGGASGIGYLAAETFAREGAKVFIFDTDREGAADLAERIQAGGGKAGWAAEEDDLRAGFEHMDRDFGGIDILFNNAGLSDNKPTLEMTAEDWDGTMNVNLRGAFLCADEAGRRMCAQGEGV
jgi:NAD(P)-dependent dehydrogenase (short-subunit alcohol dehydrogenase family)